MRRVLHYTVIFPVIIISGLISGIAQDTKTSGSNEQNNQYKCENDLIEVMFIESAKVRLKNSLLTDIKSNATEGLAQILNTLEWHQWSRFCDLDESILDSWAERGEQLAGTAIYNLNNIYSLRIPEDHDIWQICRQLEELPGILQARPYPLPVQAPIPPDYQSSQGYLKQALWSPSGVDALYAWTQTGGTGSGITICDLEYSWNYNHADITKATGSSLNSWSDPGFGHDHGTAVIGELVSDNNGWGTTGICYDANLLTCGTYYGSPSPFWNVPGAMAIAIANLNAGDIILLEQQWDFNGSNGYVPIEWWTNTNSSQTFNAVYAAIINAVANGIHVVEAGGNGSMDTDLLSWFGNSGAIIVGAGGGYSYNNRERLSFSSYGSRFDIQGWGQNITTTGYGTLYSAEGVDYYYTGSFSGTSGASPMIAGALACAEGYYLNNISSTPPSPAFMRNHLSLYGQPQVFGLSGNIGPRPDLLQAIIGFLPQQNQYDWGDAPDPTFPTLAINNGARHYINPAVYLGNYVDADPDGQPHPNANGDDFSGNDDEDGVFFTSIITAGQNASITVFASTTGYLNAWIDFNYNGSWADAGEYVLTDFILSSGPNNLNINIPLVPYSSISFARFRFSTIPGLSFTGLASDGEVEDYEIYINEALPGTIDWGDAPDGPFPTLASNNGANHVIVPGFYLGLLVDGEPDGLPNSYASGDDYTGNFDEDGVTMPSQMIPGQALTINVIASAPGILNGWIDQDVDGNWTGPDDHVFIDVPLIPGVNPLLFVASPGGFLGISYARFRFSTIPGLSFAGSAPDGEVEDYQIIFSDYQQGLDFGDAPDGPYQTLSLSNGASHQIVAGLFLGLSVDGEGNGQPDPAATGDDNLGPDEDGVTFNLPILTGQPATISVTASAPGYLNAWIDQDFNGTWADPIDYVIIDIPLTPGTNAITFIASPNGLTGYTFIRFRFSTMPGLSYTGPALDGEVEDYMIYIGDQTQTNFDFGDAPENASGNYPTTLAHNGANHIIVPHIFLGNIVDTEPDGQPDVHADCDDLDCLYPSLGDDEDGVNMPSSLYKNSTVTIIITASVDGFLDAWIDFNLNASWADAGEHIFAGTPLSTGANTLTFVVPATAMTGTTYSRFRFRDYNAPVSYDGSVLNGEVEDYAVNIMSTQYKINLKVILGGAFIQSSAKNKSIVMSTSLNILQLLPLEQPYNNPSAIWYYPGVEWVSSIPNDNVVDWMVLELRQDDGSTKTPQSFSTIDKQAVFILNDGSIVSLDGQSLPSFDIGYLPNPYAVIWHRNHLGIMSANTLTFDGIETYSYDFTSGPNQAYGGMNAQTEVASGIFGMISGDATGDGEVDPLDFIIWRNSSGMSGYEATDFNFDGQSDNQDKNEYWLPNTGKSCQVPD